MLVEKEKTQVRYEETHAHLGKKFIKSYLKSKGYTLQDLKELPPEEARQLRREAAIFASNKLAEIEVRAQFVTKIHDAYRNK